MQVSWFEEPAAPPKRTPWRAYLTWSFASAAALALIACGILFAGDPRTLFALKPDAPKEAKSSELLGAAALNPRDPALQFSRTHIGQVIFSKINSDKCRRVLFDNQTGTSYWVDDVDCGRRAEQAIENDVPNRFLEVQKSFKR